MKSKEILVSFSKADHLFEQINESSDSGVLLCEFANIFHTNLKSLLNIALVERPKKIKALWKIIIIIYEKLENFIETTEMEIDIGLLCRTLLCEIIDLYSVIKNYCSAANDFDIETKLSFIEAHFKGVSLDVILNCRSFIMPKYRKVELYLPALRKIFESHKKSDSLRTFLKVLLICKVIVVSSTQSNEAKILWKNHKRKLVVPSQFFKWSSEYLALSFESHPNLSMKSILKQIDSSKVFKILYQNNEHIHDGEMVTEESELSKEGNDVKNRKTIGDTDKLQSIRANSSESYRTFDSAGKENNVPNSPRSLFKENTSTGFKNKKINSPNFEGINDLIDFSSLNHNDASKTSVNVYDNVPSSPRSLFKENTANSKKKRLKNCFPERPSFNTSTNSTTEKNDHSSPRRTLDNDSKERFSPYERTNDNASNEFIPSDKTVICTDTPSAREISVTYTIPHLKPNQWIVHSFAVLNSDSTTQSNDDVTVSEALRHDSAIIGNINNKEFVRVNYSNPEMEVRLSSELRETKKGNASESSSIGNSLNKNPGKESIITISSGSSVRPSSDSLGLAGQAFSTSSKTEEDIGEKLNSTDIKRRRIRKRKRKLSKSPGRAETSISTNNDNSGLSKKAKERDASSDNDSLNEHSKSSVYFGENYSLPLRDGVDEVKASSNSQTHSSVDEKVIEDCGFSSNHQTNSSINEVIIDKCKLSNLKTSGYEIDEASASEGDIQPCDENNEMFDEEETEVYHDYLRSKLDQKRAEKIGKFLSHFSDGDHDQSPDEEDNKSKPLRDFIDNLYKKTDSDTRESARSFEVFNVPDSGSSSDVDDCVKVINPANKENISSEIFLEPGIDTHGAEAHTVEDYGETNGKDNLESNASADVLEVTQSNEEQSQGAINSDVLTDTTDCCDDYNLTAVVKELLTAGDLENNDHSNHNGTEELHLISYKKVLNFDNEIEIGCLSPVPTIVGNCCIEGDTEKEENNTSDLQKALNGIEERSVKLSAFKRSPSPLKFDFSYKSPKRAGMKLKALTPLKVADAALNNEVIISPNVSDEDSVSSEHNKENHKNYRPVERLESSIGMKDEQDEQINVDLEFSSGGDIGSGTLVKNSVSSNISTENYSTPLDHTRNSCGKSSSGGSSSSKKKDKNRRRSSSNDGFGSPLLQASRRGKITAANIGSSKSIIQSPRKETESLQTNLKKSPEASQPTREEVEEAVDEVAPLPAANHKDDAFRGLPFDGFSERILDSPRRSRRASLSIIKSDTETSDVGSIVGSPARQNRRRSTQLVGNLTPVRRSSRISEKTLKKEV